MLGIGEKLRGLDVERYTVDELVELRAGARLLLQEYQLANYQVPEWLTDRVTILDAEITRLRADSIRKRVRELQVRKGELRTQEQKRQDVENELAVLEAELAKV
jgi:uncharacterized small protein (DUF1192 family)